MSEQQIKEYLQKYNITSKELLASHIEELKRNTKPNTKLISELVWVLEDFFFSFFEHSACSAEKLNIVVGNLEGINRPPQKSLNNHVSEVIDTKLGEYVRTELEPDYKPPFFLDEVIKSSEISAEKTEKEENLVFPKDSEIHKKGIKESQSIEKSPIFTYCKVNKNALEALALRALYGHIKYKETDEDWQNFTRVTNASEEYANAEFRHALEIGGEEDEKEHLIASAWNAVARLEIYLRNNG